MKTRPACHSGKRMSFNFIASVIILLILTTLPSPTPSFALSLSDSASLDWSALTMTGINFSLSNLTQQQIANVGTFGGPQASTFTFSNDWSTGTVSATLPSLGNVTANLSTTAVDSSLSVFSNEMFATGQAARNVTITALNTGVLTVSIPFQVHDQGPISSDWSSFTSATLQFVAGGGTISFADGFTLQHTNDSLGATGETKTGVASISIPMTQGEVGSLNFDTREIVTVPEPETFWPLAVGLVLVGFVHRLFRSNTSTMAAISHILEMVASSMDMVSRVGRCSLI